MKTMKYLCDLHVTKISKNNYHICGLTVMNSSRLLRELNDFRYLNRFNPFDSLYSLYLMYLCLWVYDNYASLCCYCFSIINHCSPCISDLWSKTRMKLWQNVRVHNAFCIKKTFC